MSNATQKIRGREARTSFLAALASVLLVPLHGVAYGQDAVDGQQIYQSNRCVTCHGAQGQGTIGVALAGNPDLAQLDLMLDQIINGGTRMPAYGEQFSNAEIAAVATYLRTNFGNEFDPVTVEDVEAFRAQDQLQ